MATKEKVMKPAVGLTVEKLEEQLKNLNIQLQESTQKALMLQGAVQSVQLQIDGLNDPGKGINEN